MEGRTTTRRHHTTTKATCEACGYFFGYISSDGTGPLFEECMHKLARSEQPPKCPMKSRLAQYQPRVIPQGLAGGYGGPLDEDSGGYGSIARRALEDEG